MQALTPAGKMVHKITIQKTDPASSRDAAGQRVTDWLNVAVNIWAFIEPLSGRDEFVAAQRQASTTHRVKTYYGPQLANVDASHRVFFAPKWKYLGTVNDEAAMLALAGKINDWCARRDDLRVYAITGGDPSQLGDWTKVSEPSGARIFVFDGPPINVEERNRELILECTEGLRTEN